MASCAASGLGLQAIVEGRTKLALEAGPVGAHGIRAWHWSRIAAAVALEQAFSTACTRTGGRCPSCSPDHILHHAAIACGNDAVQDGEGIAHGALSSF